MDIFLKYVTCEVYHWQLYMILIVCK